MRKSEVFFEHALSSDDVVGSLNHFWIGGSQSLDRSTIRYYIDGETIPSIGEFPLVVGQQHNVQRTANKKPISLSVEFFPPLATGVGQAYPNASSDIPQFEQFAPWQNKWFGKGGHQTGWSNNFMIPFSKNIKITYQGPPETQPGDTIYMIVRGTTNLPLHVGSLPVPDSARLKLYKIEDMKLNILEFVDLVDIPEGNSGFHFATTMSVASDTNNYMEGCFHHYTDTVQDFPGIIAGTGMEDYFDSSYYFNAGLFHGDYSGCTHLSDTDGDNGNSTSWSGYRVHEFDPFFFSNGFRFEWRNGDVQDPTTGLKCTLNLEGEGEKLWDPRESVLTAYIWVYLF